MPDTLRAADLLVRTLGEAGVERVFTLSGNQILPVFDAALEAGLELVHVRHEAAAGHMADAVGRLRGRPGVALVTAGPGFANALSALYVALCAESPLVLLSGHAPRRRLGMGAFQELAQAEMAGHVAKASWTANDATRLGHDLARALRTAVSGRPGPVHVALPFDLLEERIANARADHPAADEFHPLVSLLDTPTAEAALDRLAEARHPLVLAGPALCRGEGRELLEQFAATTHIPAIGMESPRGTNDPSRGALAEVLPECDAVLLLGKRLDCTLRFGEPPTFSADCRFLQIDPERHTIEQTGRVLGDASRLVLTDLADPLPALERLLTVAGRREWPARGWCDDVAAAVDFRPPEWTTLRSPPEGPLHPAEVCRVLDGFLSETDESVFVSDGGEFGQWAQACVRGTHRVINGPSGAIGGGLPFAIAARTAFPDARIAVTLGDGTFGFHASEFDTAVRHGLPFVAVVGNDARWNAEWQLQHAEYGPDRVFGCDLLPTRYDEVAQALGGHGEFVARPDELRPALERAFASNRPACVNVLIQPAAAPVIRRK